MSRHAIKFCLLLLASLAYATGAFAVDKYDYRVVEKKPQSREHFVQGLEILDGYLYVSTGNYGRSKMLRYKLDSGALDIERAVNPRIFAEGLTVLGDKVYQLTWRNRMALVYDKATLSPQEWFRIAGEGWGLTNNGKHLIYSDGSHQLFFLSPETRRIESALQVTENGRPVSQLNELEWVEGKIWANIWQNDDIVIINPHSGEVEGRILLAGLLPQSERRPGTDVLNGIARNPDNGDIWVTGKRWPWMYRIELIPRTGDSAAPTAHSKP